jgi:endonuclease/exonuclease/phosphatase family metal-dependent hydrolase
MPSIRVATYNLYLGADVTVVFGVTDAEDLARKAKVVLEQVVATDFPGRADAVARILVDEQVDLVGLQEVAQWSREVPGDDGEVRPEVWLDFLAALLDSLGRAGQEYDVHACTANFQGEAQVEGHEAMAVLGHNVVLVRRGSGVHVIAERTGDFSRALEVTTPMPGLVLSIARSWGWVDAEVEGRPFRFVNTHLEAWREEVRNAQRDELLSVLGAPDVPVLLVGDFNATPERVGMPEEYVDAWAVAGEDGAGLTCGENTHLLAADDCLGVRIDYVWVRGARPVRCWVVGARREDRTPSGLWPSDHAGVVAEIAL